MNILMLNYEFPPIGGGASPVSYDIGKGLAGQGHRVVVITMAYQDLPLYEMMDGMEVHRVKCWRTQKMVCHPWEQATYILAAIRYIKKKISIKDYDICYTHFIIPTGVIAWWLKKKYKLPYVITSHGSDVIGHNNKRFRVLYSMVKKPWCSIVRSADAVVAPSRYLMDLIKKSESDVNGKVIRNGVDTAFFRGKSTKQKKILVMCRLQETKNVQCIIKALSLIDLGQWKIDILGDGPEKEKLKQAVYEYKLEDRVHFCGWVTNKSELHLKYLQEASIYLSASKVENCPTSILEAIACGTRVLLSDISAHRQLMENIDSNIFFQADDAKCLAQKLQAMILDSENNMVYANQYDVLQFEWRNSILQYEELLLKISEAGNG